MPMDDDPLTSPSFPAINTSDSRSYRTRRPGAAPSGPHTSPQPIGGRGSGGFSEPGQQFSPYPDRPGVPGGYSTQPSQALPPVPAAHPSAPVANPYGSYVSAPQPGYGDVAASPLDAGSYGGDYPAGQLADGSWYGPGGASASGNGYAADYQSVSYPSSAYQGGQAGPGGHGPQGHVAGQYEQRAYGTPDVAYGQDGYQGYPGYGAGNR